MTLDITDDYEDDLIIKASKNKRSRLLYIDDDKYSSQIIDKTETFLIKSKSSQNSVNRDISNINNNLIPDELNYDIDIFFKKYKKSENDIYNKKREDILFYLLSNTCNKKFQDNKWNILNDKLIKIINKITNNKNFKITKKGGRRSNYDFLLECDDLKTIYLEFKFNCKKIINIPQFLNIHCHHFTNINYYEYFYDNFLNDICKIYNLSIIEKNIYIKNIYNINYSCEPFFLSLYNFDKIKDDKFYQKQIIVKNSIKHFLNLCKININELNKKLLEQNNKIFLLWDLKSQEFYDDSFNSNDIKISSFKEIKNNNTLVFNTFSNKKIHMLLRWKNHQGILNPSWQISIKNK